MNYFDSSVPFNGNVCFISQYCPFSNLNYDQIIDTLEFIKQKLQYLDLLYLNFFVGSSQYNQITCFNHRIDLPFNVRYEIMVTNVVEMANKFNFIPNGLYHIGDFDFDIEWAQHITKKITCGSLIVTNNHNKIHSILNKYYPNKYNYLDFNSIYYENYPPRHEIIKLLNAGKIEDAKKYLPSPTIHIMQKHGLLNL